MSAHSGGKITGGFTPPVVAGRITVALVDQAAADLQLTHERTGLSKTDITNRAISLYEFIDAQLASGHDMLIRNNQTGDTLIVRLL
jgi:hypothetical protein